MQTSLMNDGTLFLMNLFLTPEFFTYSISSSILNISELTLVMKQFCDLWGKTVKRDGKFKTSK